MFENRLVDNLVAHRFRTLLVCHFVQAKQNVFRDSLARSKKSSAGAAASLISVGNINVDEMIAKLVSRMDVCREKIDVCDVNVNTEQIQSKLEVNCHCLLKNYIFVAIL